MIGRSPKTTSKCQNAPHEEVHSYRSEAIEELALLPINRSMSKTGVFELRSLTQVLSFHTPLISRV
jgi:hypothetical protein